MTAKRVPPARLATLALGLAASVLLAAPPSAAEEMVLDNGRIRAEFNDQRPRLHRRAQDGPDARLLRRPVLGDDRRHARPHRPSRPGRDRDDPGQGRLPLRPGPLHLRRRLRAQAGLGFPDQADHRDLGPEPRLPRRRGQAARHGRSAGPSSRSSSSRTAPSGPSAVSGDADASAGPAWSVFFMLQNPFMAWTRDGSDVSVSYAPDMDWSRDYGAFASDRLCIGLVELSGHALPGQGRARVDVRRRLRQAPQGIARRSTSTRSNALVDCVRSFLLYLSRPERPRPHPLVRERLPDRRRHARGRRGIQADHGPGRRARGDPPPLHAGQQRASPGSRTTPTPGAGRTSSGSASARSSGKGSGTRAATTSRPGSRPCSTTPPRRTSSSWPTPIRPCPSSRTRSGRPGPAPTPPPKSGADTGLRSFQDWWLDKLLGFMRTTGAAGFSFDHWWIAHGQGLEQVRPVVRLPAHPRGPAPRGLRRRRRRPPAVPELRPVDLAGRLLSSPDPDRRAAGELQGLPRPPHRPRLGQPPALRRLDLPGRALHAARDHARLHHPPIGAQRREGGHAPRPLPSQGLGRPRLEILAPLLDRDGPLPPRRQLHPGPRQPRSSRPSPKRTRPGSGSGSTGPTRTPATSTPCGRSSGRPWPAASTARRPSSRTAASSSSSIPTPAARRPGSSSMPRSAWSRARQLMIKELYPEEGRLVGSPEGLWAYGSEVALTLPGREAAVYEIFPAPAEIAEPVLFNVRGAASLMSTRLVLTDVTGETGTTHAPSSSSCPTKARVRALSVNGVAHPFKAGNGPGHGDRALRRPRLRAVPERRNGPGRLHGRDLQGPGRPSRPASSPSSPSARRPGRSTYTEDDLRAPWLGPWRLLLHIPIIEGTDAMDVSLKINGLPVEVLKAYNSVYPARAGADLHRPLRRPQHASGPIRPATSRSACRRSRRAGSRGSSSRTSRRNTRSASWPRRRPRRRSPRRRNRTVPFDLLPPGPEEAPCIEIKARF